MFKTHTFKLEHETFFWFLKSNYIKLNKLFGYFLTNTQLQREIFEICLKLSNIQLSSK